MVEETFNFFLYDGIYLFICVNLKQTQVKCFLKLTVHSGNERNNVKIKIITRMVRKFIRHLRESSRDLTWLIKLHN